MTRFHVYFTRLCFSVNISLVNIKSFEKLNLPDAPGVYFWKRAGKILYIGRATSLYDRVRSYFSPDIISTRGSRITDMVFKADSIEWLKTDSVLEAMIAEANLIKKHRPEYNVKEKDDKSWNYVVITRDEFPLVLTVRGRTLGLERQKKGLKIRASFGPFTNGSALREALKIIRKMFPFIDKASLIKHTNTFYRQIGLAPDTTSVEARLEYKKNIERILLFFGGKKQRLCKTLEKEMDEYAKVKEFEKAAAIKHKLFALNHIQDVSLIKENKENAKVFSKPDSGYDGTSPTPDFRIEAYDIAHMSGKESVGVMTVVCDGEAAKDEYRKFKLSPGVGNNDTASLREVIERRLNHSEWRFPGLMVMDGGRGQLNLAQKVLKEHNLTIPVVSVVKNDRHNPIDILGDAGLADKHKKAILLANSESHRFAVAYHRKLRRIRD